MSVEKVKAEVINNNNKPLTAEDLDPAKLAFISFGSLCGMGIGLFLSFVFSSPWTKIIIGGMLLLTGFFAIMKALPSLRK